MLSACLKPEEPMTRLANALLSLSLLASAAHAAAPQLKTQAPGYYRMMLGDVEVTALNDGNFMMPVAKVLTHIKPETLKSDLARNFLPPEIVPTSVNGFLVNTGAKLVLIDTGAGKLFGPTLGGLLASLKASGYTPEQVDEIYITHSHGDHIGGLSAEGKAVFPNAIVRMSKAEADFALKSESGQDMLAPYVAAGHFKPFEGDVELVPGVHAIDAHGHTPGHTNYVVQSQGQKLVLWGDTMHVAAAQFPDPTVTANFDSDSKAALPWREKLFKEVAAQGEWVAGAHLSFPGIGHLRAEGKGYVYVPINYLAKP
ncbi:MAG: MBL fold metallo-hydrolase [Paucibacter sp.]|nr:MBL fold metallo-hydrolase [Roseateles sp.]